MKKRKQRADWTVIGPRIKRHLGAGMNLEAACAEEGATKAQYHSWIHRQKKNTGGKRSSTKKSSQPAKVIFHGAIEAAPKEVKFFFSLGDEIVELKGSPKLIAKIISEVQA